MDLRDLAPIGRQLRQPETPLVNVLESPVVPVASTLQRIGIMTTIEEDTRDLEHIDALDSVVGGATARDPHVTELAETVVRARNEMVRAGYQAFLTWGRLGMDGAVQAARAVRGIR
jgi:hypothetical protein